MGGKTRAQGSFSDRFAQAIKTDKGDLHKYLRISDAEGLERAYRDFSMIFSEALYPTPDGVKTSLDDMARQNPKAASADPKAFVDMTLVRELDTSDHPTTLPKKTNLLENQ